MNNQSEQMYEENRLERTAPAGKESSRGKEGGTYRGEKSGI